MMDAGNARMLGMLMMVDMLEWFEWDAGGGINKDFGPGHVHRPHRRHGLLGPRPHWRLQDD